MTEASRRLPRPPIAVVLAGALVVGAILVAPPASAVMRSQVAGSSSDDVPAAPASVAASAPTAPASVAPSALTVPAAAETTVRVDLYRPGTFVSQTNLLQCVGASMQMMRNIVLSATDRSAATQHRLFELAVAMGDPSREGSWGGAHGASARGWAAGLAKVGVGPYRVVSEQTLGEAIALAARAIRTTGRPVGLLMWQGAHAWVMTGFTATGDPASGGTARVTSVNVLDPLYPRPGGTWGPTPTPDAGLTVARLARGFVPYRPHGRNVALRGRYVLVLPIEPGPPAASHIVGV